MRKLIYNLFSENTKTTHNESVNTDRPIKASLIPLPKHFLIFTNISSYHETFVSG